MARHRYKPDDDYSDGSNSDSVDDVSLLDEGKGFNVEVDNAGYKASPTNINNEESKDISNFDNDYNDFNIKD